MMITAGRLLEVSPKGLIKNHKGGVEPMTRIISATTLAIGLAAVALMTPSVAANAGEMAKADEIAAAVSGKSLQGSMLKDAFVEYYHPDGTIKGRNYTGKWRVTDKAMCFQYGDNPESCWALEINGPAVTLYKDGKVDGNGILIDGNPNNF